MSAFNKLLGLGGSSDFSMVFGKILLWTLVWAFFATFTNYIFGILLALIINKKGIRLKKMWRTIFVVTIAIPQFIMLLIISVLLGQGGAVNTWFESMGWKSFPFLGSLTSETSVAVSTADYIIPKITVIVINMLRGIRGSSDNSDYARRQPMLWGGGEASCNPPEGKSIANQVTVGAKDALNDGWSLLNHEKKVLSIRNKYNDFFRFGVYSALDLGNPWVGGFQITYNGSTKVLIHNSGSEVATLAYPSSGTLLEDINTSKTASSYQKGTLTLQPFSSVLIG